MMILQRTPVMIALSALLGLAGAWLIGQWLGSVPTAQPLDTEAGISVLVVKKDVPALTALTAEHVTMVSVPAALAPEQAMKESSAVSGHYTLVNLFAGEILLDARITSRLPTSLLADRLEPGMRAMTVRVNDVSGVAGFVQPGSRVDVIATRKNSSRVLLTDRHVLAIDQTTTMENDEPVVASTATLAVTPEQATRLAGALGGASLYLALRNPVEPAAAPTPKATPTGLILQRGVEGSWIKVSH